LERRVIIEVFRSVVLLLALWIQTPALPEIRGVVSNSAGTVVPGVEVTVTDPVTGTVRTVVTNASGTYVVTQITPGKYLVKATVPESRIKPAMGMAVVANETVTLNLTLGVANVPIPGAPRAPGEAATSAEPVHTTDAKLGSASDPKTIIDLPLKDRNVVGLLNLEPGVTLKQDEGGQVNGARSDQQNIFLDGVSDNHHENVSGNEGVLPTPLDSVEEFSVQTSGIDATLDRGSGAQIHLTTRRGANDFHGSAYESYRTTGLNAANYFSPVDASGKRSPQKDIRHIPGFSGSGPIIRDKVFIFGNYERNSNHTAALTYRNVPTPQFLNGHVRYLRSDSTFGELTDGCGGMLEKWTLIPCDTWNANLFGGTGLFEKYRPFSADVFHTVPSTIDNGANTLSYIFSSPIISTSNVAVLRGDYTRNDKNSFYFRTTLNSAVTTNGGPFPGIANTAETRDKSKGFATSWIWVPSPELTNTATLGLTRESTQRTGTPISVWVPNGLTSTYTNTNPAAQAINTWNLIDNLTWIRGAHTVQGGLNVRYINNAFDLAARLPAYAGPAIETAGNVGGATSPGLRRALGDTEFARVANPLAVGNAVMAATGSISTFAEDIQFDANGNKLPAGATYSRDFRMEEYELYLQDSWKASPAFSFLFGINYSVQTPPYEKSGREVNWVQDPGARYATQKDSPLATVQLPLFQTEHAGRSNHVADYYPSDTNNLAPRFGFVWNPDAGTTGHALVLRGSYDLLFDGFGRGLAKRMADAGSVGLKTPFAIGAGLFGIDGAGNPRAPRIGPNGWTGSGLPRSAFPPSPDQPGFTLPVTGTGGAGAASVVGIDRNLHAPHSHLMTFTISKELPAGWVIEGSYVGRFTRDTIGLTNLASPVNLRDKQSNTTYYDAVKSLYEADEFNSVAVADVKAIPWFENVYAGAKPIIERRMGRTFSSTTQALYAYLNQSVAPGPNAPVSLVNTIQDLESSGLGSILLQPQVKYFGLYTNLGRANYNSAQFSVRKRFSQGLSTDVNYTYSKALDIVSTTESAAVDPYHPERQYTFSDFDRRHQMRAQFIADLPFGKDRRFAPSMGRWMNALVGNWETSGVILAASGLPWSFKSDRYNFQYSSPSVPRLVKPVSFQLTKSNGEVFMSGATGGNFLSSYPGGPVARNQGRGPNYFDADFSLTKNFTIVEGKRARLRWEMFNVLNHPNFALPASRNVDANDGNLGRITNTVFGNERTMQFTFRLEW